MNEGMGSKNSTKMTLKWKILTKIARLAVKLGSKKTLYKQLSSWGGLTPLHAAATTNQLSIAEMLIQQGASCHSKNVEGLTPLELAKNTYFGDVPKNIEILLNAGLL